MLNFSRFLFLFAVINVINGLGIPSIRAGCGGSLFVQDALVIDAPIDPDCIWTIKTAENRILSFSIVGEGITFQQVEEYLTIHDGLDETSPILLVENQKILADSNKNLPVTVYTTRSLASIRFKKTPVTPFQLKIQKAVDCPADIGTSTTCGRIVDAESCYCVLLNQKSWTDQLLFCSNNGMLMLSLETANEEAWVVQTWNVNSMWMSLNDQQSEGNFVWQSTGAQLFGYSNWAKREPNNGGGLIGDEDCVVFNDKDNSEGLWNDAGCNNGYSSVCELHP